MAPKRLGPYRLTKLLGSGRTAEVYCARHRITKELVAIKLLHEYLTDRQMKQKFQAEAQIVQMLSHPGIVQILDTDFYQQTRPYIVMIYAPGNSLRQKHPHGSILSFQTILSYTQQIASALAYAHQKNIVHCDIKPENILIGRDGQLLLSDFGIARIRETTLSQTTRDAFGTATYMAPEQFRGKYSPATDQYALAAMVYEWFCGSPPFQGNNYNQLMDRHMTMPLPSLQEVCKEHDENRNIPLAVEHVLSKALKKDSEARFSNVEEFAQALAQAIPLNTVLNDVPSYAENATSTIQSYSNQRRFSRRAVLLGSAGLIAVTIVGTFTWRSPQWLIPFSPISPSATSTHTRTPSPRTPLASGSPTQTPLGQLEPIPHSFTLTVDVNGLLTNSPQAINAVKQQVKGQSLLRGRSVGNAIVYGGAPSVEDISQAEMIAQKVYSILGSLGNEGFAFQRSAYYSPLFMLGSPANQVRVDVFLFVK